MIDLTLNPELTRKILTGFLHSEITRSGFTRAVVGLSGGIDSAPSCVLAADALGPENVLAVRMPYRASSPDSLEHAQMVIDRFKVRSETVEITPMADPLLEREGEMSKVRQGNVLARMRMIVLYDRSAAFQGLVVGTSNKTEILLGYSTLWGDSACALNPLGDLYKTQVRQLAGGMGIPAAIIDKPPSADLWADQTDEGELNCSTCWWTSATAPRNVSKLALVKDSCGEWWNASAAASSNVCSRPSPRSATAR